MKRDIVICTINYQCNIKNHPEIVLSKMVKGYPKEEVINATITRYPIQFFTTFLLETHTYQKDLRTNKIVQYKDIFLITQKNSGGNV